MSSLVWSSMVRIYGYKACIFDSLISMLLFLYFAIISIVVFYDTTMLRIHKTIKASSVGSSFKNVITFSSSVIYFNRFDSSGIVYIKYTKVSFNQWTFFTFCYQIIFAKNGFVCLTRTAVNKTLSFHSDVNNTCIFYAKIANYEPIFNFTNSTSLTALS